MPPIPPYYHNSVFAQTSQNNFQQQQQQQQNILPQMIPNIHPYNINPQGPGFQNQPLHPYQGECLGNPSALSQNLITNPYQQNPNLCSTSPRMQNQNYLGCLPQGIPDQFRSCMNSAAPIFILPNACPNPVPTTPQLPNSVLGYNMSYPMNCSPTGLPPPFCIPPSCIPYALPIPIYNNVPTQDRKKEKSSNCDCCPKGEMMKETFKNPNVFANSDEHKCKESKDDDTICARKNCPSSLNLQALASQFLSIQGIIPCVATRLILRKVPGSNVTTSVEDTVNRALMSISQLKKEELLTESRNAQHVNALINLHMTANPPSNIIPILTMIQLKVNVLKAQVECLVNKKVMENQGIGAEGGGNLDPFVLSLKTNAELREFLAALKDKECEERVNLNFAPYHAQRVIAESRLTNIQNKISQVEDEMTRRRSNPIQRTSIVNRCQISSPCCYTNNSTLGASQMCGTSGNSPTQTYESPDPFLIQVRSPKRLNLKPHVGSPGTTYEQSTNTGKDTENVCCNSLQQNPPKENRFSQCPSDSTMKNCLKDKRKPPVKSDVDDPSSDSKDDGNKETSQKSSANLGVIDGCDDKEEKICSNQTCKVSSEIDNIPSKEFSEESRFESKSDFEGIQEDEKKIADNNSLKKTSGKTGQLKRSDSQNCESSVDEDLERESKLGENVRVRKSDEDKKEEKDNEEEETDMVVDEENSKSDKKDNPRNYVTTVYYTTK